MRKELVLPLTALVGGAAGFFLRRWELSSAFEADTGLPVSGAPATLALFALSAVLFLALAILSWGTGRGFQGSYDEAFQTTGNTPYLVGMIASAFLMAGAGTLLLAQAGGILSGSTAGAGLSGFLGPLVAVGRELLLALLALASAVSLFLLGKNNYRGEGRGDRSGCLLVPAYASCVWLIVSYLDHSGDPIVLDYVYQLFAVVASVLGCYFLAGFSYRRPKAFPAILFSLTAMYFCLVTLADQHSAAYLLLYVSYFLYFGVSAGALLHNLDRPSGRRMPGGKRLPHTEEHFNQEETPDEG